MYLERNSIKKAKLDSMNLDTSKNAEGYRIIWSKETHSILKYDLVDFGTSL